MGRPRPLIGQKVEAQGDGQTQASGGGGGQETEERTCLGNILDAKVIKFNPLRNNFGNLFGNPFRNLFENQDRLNGFEEDKHNICIVFYRIQ